MLVKILMGILVVLSVLLGVYSIYYLAIGVHCVKKPKKLEDADKINKFAILIAARNEEPVIHTLIETLKEQNYPKDKYDIIVIPNNCTDDTKGASERAGARIYECKDPVKSKGEVLHQVIRDLLLYEDHDAYIIFDADNLVDKNFVAEMNRVVDAGYGAGQGFRDSKNPTETYMSSAYSIFYLLVNLFYNQPRSALGMNSLISGTGFMATRRVLEKLGGWNTSTLTEDAEFTVQNSLLGETVAWVPEARFYDEQPSTLAQSWHQRIRWSTGSQQGMKKNGTKAIRAVFKGEGKDMVDMFVMMTATYVQDLSFLATVLGLVIVALTHPGPLLIGAIVATLIGMVIMPTILAILVLRFNKRPLKPMWKGIAMFWFFLITWIPINFYVLFKDNVEWKPIVHTSDATLEEVEK
ncbi:glycosyltransferase family 2 protein [Guggenheimella bovis]